MLNSVKGRYELHDVYTALALLSRIPLPIDHDRAGERSRQAVWAYPIAGLIIGIIVSVIATIWSWFGLPAGMVAAVVLTAQIVITGAMHEDGLADSADGLWGGWNREKRLEIMKDSHIGTYGVLALGLSLIVRRVALTTVIEAGWMWCAVIAAAVLSRVPMTILMNKLPFARAGGLARSVGQPDRQAVAASITIGLVITALITGWMIIPIFIFVGLATIKAMWIAQTKIGGQTGDILGATQQLAEITILGVLASIAV